MSGKTCKALILFVVPFILYIVLLPVMPLMEPDEGRYSAISSYMNKSGDYVTPRLKETVYIEKPPLAYWATALSFKIFGENEFSSRLFAGLCAWGCILLVYAMGNFIYKDKTGLFAAAVLSTSLFHFAIGRINILDMPVAFFLSMAIWSGYRYFIGKGKGWLYLFYGSSALAFLTKGLIGIVFPAAIIIIWLLFSKRWREVFKLFSPIGVSIYLAISLPWIILVQKANPDFLRFFFVQEHFQRYTKTIHQHYEPFYFYIPFLFLGTLPWCAFIFRALRTNMQSGAAMWFKKFSSCFGKEETVFLLSWAGFITLFFSFSSSKLIPYIAPVFLPLSLFMGRLFSTSDGSINNGDMKKRLFNWEILPVIFQSMLFIGVLMAAPFMDIEGRSMIFWWPWVITPIVMQILMILLPNCVNKQRGVNWFMTVYIISTFFFAAMIFPAAHFLTPYKSAYALAEAVKKYVPADNELYQYNMSLYGLDFYGKIRTPVVNDIGEVSYGAKFLPIAEKEHFFLNSQEFITLCKEREIYCATKREDNVAGLKKVVPSVTVLWNNKRYYLLRLGNRQ